MKTYLENINNSTDKYCTSVVLFAEDSKLYDKNEYGEPVPVTKDEFMNMFTSYPSIKIQDGPRYWLVAGCEVRGEYVAVFMLDGECFTSEYEGGQST